MQITKLDHVNVRTTRLEEMICWYIDILGMRSGDRPDFPFPGAWLYPADSELAMVHLVGIDGDPGTGSEAPLKLEHFAFAATGLAAFEQTLQRHEVKYRRVDNAVVGLIQVNLWDPDGNHIHVDFSLEEAAAG